MVQKISGSSPIFGGSVPQIELQSTKQTDETTGSVFHKYDKSSDREINAIEMGIEETLTDVLKHLDKLSKNVRTTAEG